MMTRSCARRPFRDQDSRRAGRRRPQIRQASPGDRQAGRRRQSVLKRNGRRFAGHSIIHSIPRLPNGFGGAAQKRVSIRGSLSKDGDPRGFT
jgi:hypothetical protein